MKEKQKQFTMKISTDTKNKLELLSNNINYKFNLSAVIRDLIEQAYAKYAKQ